MLLVNIFRARYHRPFFHVFVHFSRCPACSPNILLKALILLLEGEVSKGFPIETLPI